MIVGETLEDVAGVSQLVKVRRAGVSFEVGRQPGPRLGVVGDRVGPLAVDRRRGVQQGEEERLVHPTVGDVRITSNHCLTG